MLISSRELAERAGISWAYASQLLSDDIEQRRDPSLKMALRIYDATQLQLGALRGLQPHEIDTLRKIAA